MSFQRFDIRFAGELVPGADARQARQQLQELFKLSDAAGEHLFSGKTITIKRNVDSDTVARYRERFRRAGALIEAAPLSALDEVAGDGSISAGASMSSASEEPRPGPAEHPMPSAPAGTALTLAPPGEWLEPVREIQPPQIDTSHLSLVPGTDWTFEDCIPPPPRVAPADISHLRLEPVDTDTELG